MTDMVAARPAHVPEDHVVDFDLYAPPGSRSDLHRAWSMLQAEGVPDIVWTPRNGGHWIVTRAHLINEVMSDYTRFSSNSIIIPKETTPNRLLPIMVDPPAHRPYRMLLNSSLSPKMVARAQERIRSVAAELVDAIRPSGNCEFVSAYAEQLPIRIFLSMADLPLTDAATLRRYADAINRPDPETDWEGEASPFSWALKGFFDYLRPVLDERRGSNRDDILSRIVNGEVDGRALTAEEALQICTQTLVGGLDTVVNFLGFIMVHLARYPSDREELVADPTLIPVAIEEMFRRYPIVTIGREVAKDVEYAGVRLRKGDMIATPTPLAGIDDRVNPSPMNVDFHRASSEHTTFGNGAHRCPGAQLARTEIRITLEEWLSRIPDFSLMPDHDIRYAGGLTATVEQVHLVWPR